MWFEYSTNYFRSEEYSAPDLFIHQAIYEVTRLIDTNCRVRGTDEGRPDVVSEKFINVEHPSCLHRCLLPEARSFSARLNRASTSQSHIVVPSGLPLSSILGLFESKPESDFGPVSLGQITDVAARGDDLRSDPNRRSVSGRGGCCFGIRLWRGLCKWIGLHILVFDESEG